MTLTLDRETRLMRMFRAEGPGRWAEVRMNWTPMAYRSQSELETWLDERPKEEHVWARRALQDGLLRLDPSRSYQRDGLDMLAEPGRYIWRWPNASGKTTAEAIAILWFLDVYPDGVVVTTAGTWSQIRDQLWREIPFWAGRLYDPNDMPFSIKEIMKTGINVDDKWYAIGRAANKEATFEGIHSRYVFVIFDEAKAIPQQIYDAARRILRGTGGSAGGKLWWLLASTPSSPIGPFYQACESSRWKEFKLSAYETAMLNMSEIQDDLDELGESGPLFSSMVLAEFPIEGEDTILPLSKVEACIPGRKAGDHAREYWRARDVEPMVGIDVARHGSDETVVGQSLGFWLQEMECWRGHRITETCGRTLRLLKQWGILPGNVQVDDTGVGGGLTDLLIEHKMAPTPIDNGSAAADRVHYANWICEAWFKVQRAMNDGLVCIPNDRILINQLASRKYGYTSDGTRFKLESKAAVRAAGRPSPDRAESYIYSSVRKVPSRRIRAGGVIGAVADRDRERNPDGDSE